MFGITTPIILLQKYFRLPEQMLNRILRNAGQESGPLS